MKLPFSKIFGTALLAGVAVFTTPSVQAIGINGEIVYAGGVTSNSSDLTTATALSNFLVYVVAGTGDYSSLTFGTPVAHSNMTINPFPALGYTPLWTIVGGYSFDLLTLQISPLTTSTELVLTGTGIAKITGFDDTPGKWNLTANTTKGAIFSFSGGVGAEPARVPDGGTTLALFGLALLGLFGFRQLAQKQA